MKKIFFGCTMRGGYSSVSREDLARLAALIEAQGARLMSFHQTQPDIVERERAFTASEIHDRDYAWLLEADAGIFEISNPSLGTGGEITDLCHLGKPILLLYRRSVEQNVSAYILGKQGSRYVGSRICIGAYSNEDEVVAAIRSFIATV